MLQTYKRRLDSRKYGYSEDSMKKAVADVRENGASIKKAAFLYRSNTSTVTNHLKNTHAGKVGRPTILTYDEEQLKVHALTKLGDWGFGIDRNEVQHIVVDYLNNVNTAETMKNGKLGLGCMHLKNDGKVTRPGEWVSPYWQTVHTPAAKQWWMIFLLIDQQC